jgi:preprotein translocase subunit SecB
MAENPKSKQHAARKTAKDQAPDKQPIDQQPTANSAPKDKNAPKDNNASNQEQTTQEQGHQVLIRTIYTKDLSYEAPNAPEIFRAEWKPEVALQFDIRVNPLVEETYEVVLTLTVTVKIGDKTAYLVEMQQAGIFSVRGFKEQELAPLFYVYAPTVLFPYARQSVTDLVAKGGFPHLVLQHIHFDQVYAQKGAEQQQQTSNKPH